MRNIRNDVELRKLNKICKKVNSNKTQMEALSDEDLRRKTFEFKERIAKGETLDEILPEAFAAIREACRRVLGLYPFDVQVLGAIALHQGRIVDMKTGEGKTLVAVLPIYLNALTGRSVILVTANGYLARRDAEEMGPVYRFMGLSIGIASNDGLEAGEKINKKAVYACDIVYTTHGEFGFDYLIHNLARSEEERFLREFYYILIDEADTVLLDSAQNPLVIAGSPRVQSNLYKTADYFVSFLREDLDYEVGDECVWLTEQGIARAERYYGIENLYSERNFELVRHINLALRAHLLYEKNRDYVVEDGKVKLLDGKCGRIMDSTHLSFGQHQSFEMKEKVELTQENRSVASITYQNLFELFEKVAGMSGTAITDAEELFQLYHLRVVEIPTNQPVLRVDAPDQVYSTAAAQISAAIEKIKTVHGTHRPVLAVTDSIATAEIISDVLLKSGIPHNVLTAYHVANEAKIIKEAGRRDAVTVSTSIAGRGTDIRLDEFARKAGGLMVIGIGKMSNRRLELQARGRAGRQGDPGDSVFFVSLDDEVVDQYGPKWLDKIKDGDYHIVSRRINHTVKRCQKISEDVARVQRKRITEMNDVMRIQRNLMYSIRDDMIQNPRMTLAGVTRMTTECIHDFLDSREEITENEGKRFAMDTISYRLNGFQSNIDWKNKEQVIYMLLCMADLELKRKFEELEKVGLKQRLYRLAVLSAVDEAWIEQVDYLQQLTCMISGRSLAQRDPIVEYNKEAYMSFEKMKKRIRLHSVRNLYLSEIRREGESIRLLLP